MGPNLFNLKFRPPGFHVVLREVVGVLGAVTMIAALPLLFWVLA